MKSMGLVKIIGATLLAGAITLGAMGCSNLDGFKPREIVSVEPLNEKMVFVEYKDNRDHICQIKVRQSQLFICGDIILDPKDYLEACGGLMEYGPFDAEEYEEYKLTH